MTPVTLPAETVEKIREALLSCNEAELGAPKWFDEGLVWQALKLLPTPVQAGRDAEEYALSVIDRLQDESKVRSDIYPSVWGTIRRALTQPNAEVIEAASPATKNL